MRLGRRANRLPYQPSPRRVYQPAGRFRNDAAPLWVFCFGDGPQSRRAFFTVAVVSRHDALVR
jgi:hypothetical protein